MEPEVQSPAKKLGAIRYEYRKSRILYKTLIRSQEVRLGHSVCLRSAFLRSGRPVATDNDPSAALVDSSLSFPSFSSFDACLKYDILQNPKIDWTPHQSTTEFGVCLWTIDCGLSIFLSKQDKKRKIILVSHQVNRIQLIQVVQAGLSEKSVLTCNFW